MDTHETHKIPSRHPVNIVAFRERSELVVTGKTKLGMSLGKSNKGRFGHIIAMMPHEKSLCLSLDARSPQSPETEFPGKCFKSRFWVRSAGPSQGEDLRFES
jgi:hypothetical protein